MLTFTVRLQYKNSLVNNIKRTKLGLFQFEECEKVTNFDFGKPSEAVPEKVSQMLAKVVEI